MNIGNTQLSNGKRNKLAAVIALALASSAPLAFAGTVTGPGNSATVDASTPEESWTVTNQATLNVTAGGVTQDIALHNGGTLNGQGRMGDITSFASGSINLSGATAGRVFADGNLGRNNLTIAGTTLRGDNQALVLIASDGTVSGSDIRSETNSAIELRYHANGASSLSVDGSRVSGKGIGAAVRDLNELILTGTFLEGRADIVGDPDFDNPGTGLRMTGSKATVAQGSVVQGGGWGVQIAPGRADDRVESQLTVDASRIHGVQESGILVEGQAGRNAIADIQIRNGSEIIGGNGFALDVYDASQVTLQVDASVLTGGIRGEVDSSIDATLRNSSMVGAAINVDRLALDNSSWTLTADSNVGALANGIGSVITLGDGQRFNTLTVEGDYSGGGTLVFNTVLADDASDSDRLHVIGNTSGQTQVQINNVGGAGAQTVDGIQLIQVDGASNGEFSLAGRAVGGQYEYFLFKGGKADPNDGDWYLRSQLQAPTDPCLVDPNQPGCEIIIPDPCTIDPSLPQCVPTPVLRPEPGAYLANQTAAINLFQHTLHDRHGERAFDGELRGAWARVSRNQADYGALAGQLDVDSNSSVLQVGTDVFGWGENSRARIGVMLASGQANSQVSSKLTGYSAKGKVRGNALGVYGTWAQRPGEASGAYVDGWLQYGRYDNSVEGVGLQKESYDATSWTGSVEAGYSFNLFTGERTALFIEPQLQLSYTDYSADALIERNGTVVETDRGGGLASRVGVRVYGHAVSEQFNRVQPYVAVNWLHGRSDANAMSFDGERMLGGEPQDRYEAKFGVQAQLGGAWSGWADLGVQSGQGDYRNIGGQLGLKYRW